jgi:hypothetical protein
MATIDYMVCAYGPYSASATGGNGWSRDFLAGVLTLPATPFFESKSSNQPYPDLNLINIDIGGKNHLADASTILFCISFILVVAVYVIYWKGPVLRKRSPFAQQLSEARAELDIGGGRLARMPSGSRASSFARSQIWEVGRTVLSPLSRIQGSPASRPIGRHVQLQIQGQTQGRTALLMFPYKIENAECVTRSRGYYV